MASTTRSLHVPLPAPLYDSLRKEARRSSIPATRAAREAIRWWLQERKRANLASSIARYARRAAGSLDDLDESLEKAGLECIEEE
ncbi:MAG: hypothetical protein HY900_34360 [Deltaproteobacteria bacterium]|nr:hypothetical protein [Deltaproteobacteria bacterium]